MATKKDFLSDLGQRIQQVRKQAGITNRERLAQKMGICLKTCANYERGKRTPSADFIEKFCNEFKVTPNWLFGREEE